MMTIPLVPEFHIAPSKQWIMCDADVEATMRRLAQYVFDFRKNQNDQLTGSARSRVLDQSPNYGFAIGGWLAMFRKALLRKLVVVDQRR